MKKVNYELIDIDNGDTVLAILDDNGTCVYYHTYETESEQLTADVAAVEDGADPIADGWDGNADNNMFDLSANDLYKQIS